MIRVDVPVVDANGVVHERKVVEVELSREALEQILDAGVRLVAMGGRDDATFNDFEDALKTYGIMR